MGQTAGRSRYRLVEKAGVRASLALRTPAGRRDGEAAESTAFVSKRNSEQTPPGLSMSCTAISSHYCLVEKASLRTRLAHWTITDHPRAGRDETTAFLARGTPGAVPQMSPV
jgi:hypothetical protein